MSRCERVYGMLLLAYPKEFRRDYGPQMEQAFGDLYRVARDRGGKGVIASLWWRTIVDLARTALAQRMISRADQREVAMYEDRRLAVVGTLLVLAPLYFVSASLLRYGLGVGLLLDPLEAFLSTAGRREIFNLVSPVVFLGGLGLALALNLYAVTRLNFSRDGSTIVGKVEIKRATWNIAVAVVSVLLLITLVVYAFLENFAYLY